jgi:hypothetical protein
VNCWLKLSIPFLLTGLALSAQQPSGLVRDPSGWEDILPPASLQGWTRLPIGAPAVDPVNQWHRDGDLLVCDGTRGHEWLRMDRETGDFIFHAEFRFLSDPRGKGYNSGIFVRTAADYTSSLEPWVQMQVGSPVGAYLFGVLPFDGRLRSFNVADRVKPPALTAPGVWNTVEITARGPVLSVWANGALVCEYPYTTVARGHIGLEAEGYRIEFRNLKWKSLEPAASR